MTAINPYLNFNGNAEEAFNFYKTVFGNDFTTVMRFKDVPPEFQDKEAEADKIMHIALPIGNGNTLMGSDVPDKYGKMNTGNAIQIAISTDSDEDADRIFNGLANGGKVNMAMSNTFWGAYFGMLKDKYDVPWMVSHDKNGQQ